MMDLVAGLDFRKKEYRREVFLRFYDFHLRYRSHPGGVYYLIPYLAQEYGWTEEEKLWFCFLNGNTQNPVTSWLLHQVGGCSLPGPIPEFFQQNYRRLMFDTDRRHHKPELERAAASYITLVDSRPQFDFWTDVAKGGFAGVWDTAKRIHSFGRLSTFSYCEYLKIAGIPFDCDNLFLHDLHGSKSHRNGLCIVTGQDEYDWHHTNPLFDGQYTYDFIEKLNDVAWDLLDEAGRRNMGEDVSFFTLESALCTYKSWHRRNRRYPNVYNDMLHDRIREAEVSWPEVDFGIFWQARRHCLPEHLRLEDNPGDPGCVPEKQNHYLNTGQPIMMDVEWPCFKNDFNDACRTREFAKRRVFKEKRP